MRSKSPKPSYETFHIGYFNYQPYQTGVWNDFKKTWTSWKIAQSKTPSGNVKPKPRKISLGTNTYKIQLKIATTAVAS